MPGLGAQIRPGIDAAHVARSERQRYEASLDIFWLRAESLEDTDNLPPPGVIAAEIVEDLEAALTEFSELADSLAEIESSAGSPHPGRGK